jgi:membrane fusion protein, adhesin transport system
MSTHEARTSSPRLDALLTDHPLPSWRMFAWPVMVMMVGMIVWSNFAKLDEVAIASGEVVPVGKVKVVQHLEGGIIQDLFVSEGDAVKKGDNLLQLDLASSGTNKEELQVRLDSELLTRARLLAEAEGKDVQFPAEIAERRPTLLRAQRQAFEARKREFASTIRVMDQQVKQKELETQELQARRKAVKRNLGLARERLKISKSLLSEGLTAKIEHLELEAEVESLDGELKSLDPSIPKAQSAVEESRQRLEESETRFRREAREELDKAQQSIARINELLAKATEQGIRANIKSPIDGVVKNMRYNTIGGVVKPGEPILEIVPTGERLVVQAKLNPTERGFITEGQKAVVKISSYDFARYGGLDGEVIRVGADASIDEDGSPFFRVIVSTDRNYLGDEEGDLPITPGMQATVDIHTGKKSVMDYLIRPILKMKHEAFRER